MKCAWCGHVHGIECFDKLQGDCKHYGEKSGLICLIRLAKIAKPGSPEWLF